MAITVGTAYSGSNPSPAYSGVFIPEIWSGKIIEKFYASTVLAAISNTDYEGEIKQAGDKVKIRTKPTVTIRDYQVNQSLVVERPSSNLVDFSIDYAKYFNTVLDDVMEVQADINLMNLFSEDAAEQMKITIDTAVLLGLVNQATATYNRGTTAGKISAAWNRGATTTPLATVARNPTAGQVEMIDLLVRLGAVLDEQNIPESGRWVVLPTWAAAYIKMSELRDAALTGDGVSTLRNGKLGQVDRFTIYSSNLLPAGVAGGLAAGEFAIFAGHSHALTFASQMTKVETLRSENTFGTLLRGLQVYGYKVLDGQALAQAIVTKA
jgi:small nuclear ribonucleoprotein (snRNP)-like protein